MQTGAVEPLAVVVSLPIGVLAALILVANNLRDIPTDIDAGKRTLAVVMGDDVTRSAFTIGAIASVLLVVAISNRHPGALAGLAGALPLSVAVRQVRQGARGRDLVPVLGATSLALLLTGLGLGLGLAVWG
jgi:1,4-dihydroxy-2-naphthoate octaprenyltransferase